MLCVLSILVLVTASATLIGTSDIRATRNYRGASQAHFVAESAIAEALQRVNATGIVDFDNEVTRQWATLWGSSSHAFAPVPGYAYTVSALSNAGDPANSGSFVATASGPEGSRNVVVARINRSNIPSTTPGVIYLAPDSPTSATFNGNAFRIDGNDRNYTSGAGPGAPVPGISTRNSANTQEAINSLAAQQLDNVTGLGYGAGPPIVPSILTAPAGPSAAQVNQIVSDLLARPGTVINNASQVNGNVNFGTPASPLITYFPANVEIKGTGNASGAGILIIEGDLTIKGSFSFDGLVLVRGRTQVVGDTDVTGNATVYGALWTNDINLVVGGSALLQYSTQALALANLASGGAALPAPLRVASLADCTQLAAGVGGCP